MALAFVIGRDIVIVLDEENVQRIQECDPFELDAAKMSVPLPIPFRVIVCYAKKDEQAQLQAFKDRGDIGGLQAYLYRGFKVTASDHDRPHDKYKTS